MKKMNHGWIRVVGLAVLAALAIAAVAASSASALPEFGQCFVQPKHEGKYTNSVCTAKAKKVNEKFTGEFEWRKATELEAAKKKLTGTGGAVHLPGLYRACESFTVRAQKCHEGETEETIGPLIAQCTSEENQAEISGTNALKNVKVIFRGCEANGFGGKCQSAGATEGEIKLNTLKGKLGFINKKTTPRQVGLVLEAATKKGKIAIYKCNASELSFAIGEGNETEGCVYPLTKCGGDGVISAITPINVATSEFTQVFTANAETAEELPSKFEGTSPLKQLEGYFFNTSGATTMWSRVAESLTNSDKAPEAIELKAN
jgi:hypothetical protein